MATATATTCSHCRTALTVDDPRSLGVCEACHRDVIDRTERRGRYARRTAPQACPVCHCEAPGLHFHVRVGSTLPAQFTRCPNDTES